MGGDKGPSPFELVDLGPFRRVPKGWLAARAMPVEHRVTADPYSGDGDHAGGGGAEIETSTRLHVVWDVHIPGRQVYRFSEVRKSPMWASASTGLVGSGNRWYKPRARLTYGLLASLGVPCFVNPENGHQIWIDWDAAYDEHVPAWDQHSAVHREVAKRRNPYERMWNRALDPFAPKLSDADQHLADAQIAKEDAERAALEAKWREQGEAQMAAMGFGPAPEGEKERYDAWLADITRIYNTGREAEATVTAAGDTGRTLNNIPVYAFELEVHEPTGTRALAVEMPMGPRQAKRYKPGKRTKVRIDPADPAKLTLA